MSVNVRRTCPGSVSVPSCHVTETCVKRYVGFTVSSLLRCVAWRGVCFGTSAGRRSLVTPKFTLARGDPALGRSRSRRSASRSAHRHSCQAVRGPRRPPRCRAPSSKARCPGVLYLSARPRVRRRRSYRCRRAPLQVLLLFLLTRMHREGSRAARHLRVARCSRAARS